jgi:IPT/TIG domain-containing protein
MGLALRENNMNTLKTISLLTLIALTMACGYSSKPATPAAGNMPTIAQLNPDNATAGGAPFTLTVTGTNFGAKAVVNWNGAAQTSNTTFVSGTEVTVAVPASAIMAAGTVQVTVTNPGTPGTGMYGSGGTAAATSSPMAFTIN